MAICADPSRVHNGPMNKANQSAVAPAPGRGTVTRLSAARRSVTSTKVNRARDARRALRSREERFAHLKRMYD
jgi:hypothetical protein